MFFKIPRKVISDMVEDYTEILRGKSLIIILKKNLWMNHITNPRISNLIRQKSRCCKGRNKFKFTITSRWRDIAEVTCPTMVTRIFSLILSFRIRYFHALLDNSCMLEVIPDSPFTPCNTMWCDTTRRGEPCLKLFRNEISRGTKRDYGAERLFARVARVRIAAVPYIKLSAGDVAGAYDTYGSVKRLYYSWRGQGKCVSTSKIFSANFSRV